MTALIDLTQSEEEILANMKQKGRYNIKTAQKHEVKVEKSEPVQNAKQQNIHEPVHDFYELLQETTQRNHFAQNNFEYYQKLVQSLEEYDLGGLYVAKKDDEIIAAAIFVYYGNVGTYYYGASTSDNAKRKYMASYLLQWEAIKEAKKRGCQWFDFLGVADES